MSVIKVFRKMEHAKVVLINPDEKARRSARAVLEWVGHEVIAEIGHKDDLPKIRDMYHAGELPVDVWLVNHETSPRLSHLATRAFSGVAIRYNSSVYIQNPAEKDIIDALVAIEQI